MIFLRLLSRLVRWWQIAVNTGEKSHTTTQYNWLLCCLHACAVLCSLNITTNHTNKCMRQSSHLTERAIQPPTSWKSFLSTVNADHESSESGNAITSAPPLLYFGFPQHSWTSTKPCSARSAVFVLIMNYVTAANISQLFLSSVTTSNTFFIS